MSEFAKDRKTNGILPQMQQLVFITQDGHRISVSRAIATEASFMLRDLLDGQDWSSEPARAAGDYGAAVGPNASRDVDDSDEEEEDDEEDYYPNDEDGEEHSPGGPADIDAFFSSNATAQGRPVTAPAGGVAAVTAKKVDVLDSLFGGPAAPADSPSVSAIKEPAIPVGTPSIDRKGEKQQKQKRPRRARPEASPPAPPTEVELPFPYLPSTILSRVVRHMNYHYRISTFGIEAGGPVRVYASPMREIARPMTMPLAEYLDPQDRVFVDEWDDETTIWMVKAATLLNYPDLMQLASAKLGSLMREKNVDSMRALLGLESTDFTPAEEAELKKEQQFDFPK